MLHRCMSHVEAKSWKLLRQKGAQARAVAKSFASSQQTSVFLSHTPIPKDEFPLGPGRNWPSRMDRESVWFPGDSGKLHNSSTES